MNTSRDRNLRISKLMVEVQERAEVAFDGYIQNRKWFEDQFNKYDWMKESSSRISDFICGKVAMYTNKGLVVFVDGFSKGIKQYDGFDHREMMARTMAYISCASVIDTDPEINTSNVFARFEFVSLLTTMMNFEKYQSLFDRCCDCSVLIISNVNMLALHNFILSKDGGEMKPNEQRIMRIKNFFDEVLRKRVSNKKLTIITMLSGYNEVFSEREQLGDVFDRMIYRIKDESNNFTDGMCSDEKCCRINIPITPSGAKSLGYMRTGEVEEENFIKTLSDIGIVKEKKQKDICASIRKVCLDTKVSTANNKKVPLETMNVFYNLREDIRKVKDLGAITPGFVSFIENNVEFLALLRSERNV